MMRRILDALYCPALFGALPYWLCKIPQARRYRAGVIERLGFVTPRESSRKCLWIHCASVGEASIPRELVRRFRERHPDWQIVFSTMTDTGAERLRKLYPGSGVFYWPLDLSGCVDRALDRVRPDMLLLVEQELWPNAILGFRAAGVPVGIINGRIRQSSVPFVRTLIRLLRPISEAIRFCCARSEADAERYASVGLLRSRISVSGSLKYEALDAEVSPEEVEKLRSLFGFSPESPVLVGGSTHPGEESLIAQVWDNLRKEYPDLRLVLAPRHIERADQLAVELSSAGFQVVRKTDLEDSAAQPDDDCLVLVDTIGDLVACYAMATCVFVGRSLFPPGGGQNMMEPAALGRPVIVGEHTGNFDPEMEILNDSRAVIQVGDEEELQRVCARLLGNPAERKELGRNARNAIRKNQGAAAKTIQHVERLIGTVRSMR